MSSPAQHINNRENDNPHCIDKVPIEPEHLNSLCMLLAHLSRKREPKNQREHDQAHYHVRGMKPDERIKRGTEEIRTNRQPVPVNELVPFLCGTDEKNNSK